MYRVALLACALLAAGCKVYTTDGPQLDPDADKQYVCHEGTRTLRLTDAEVRTHLNHGDRLGRCK